MSQEEMASALKTRFPPKDDVIDGVPKWGRDNPNLYGAYGAIKEIGKTVPYARYLDPEDRAAFLKKDTQGQTNELLKEALGAQIMLGAGPILKGVGAIAGPAVQRVAPKLHEVLTKSRTISPKKAEPPAPAELPKPDELPKPAEAPSPPLAIEAVAPEVPPKAPLPVGKQPLPKQDVMGLEEQKNVIQKIIQEGIVDKERPFVADETQRAMYNIADTITKYPAYGREILTKYNITPEELSSEILKAGTVHGKGLNQFSQWARAMKQAFPDDPVIQETLGKVGQLEPLTTWDHIKNAYRVFDDKRRMLMVTQVATAARNAISQGLRYGTGILDDGLRGAMKIATGVPKQEAFAQFMADWTAIMGRFSPKQRANLDGVLAKYPESAAEMLSAPIHDITLGGKLSNALMYLNRTQEYFFRKMVFDSRITAWGKLFEKPPYSADIPQAVLDDAVKTALEYTYAAPQKHGFGRAVMDAYEAIPMLTTIHPYPRFWMNSVKFLWDFNPTGYLSAASRARFFSKDPDAVYQAASRATIGTMLLGAGLAFRNSEYAGEKWYEINVGDNRYIDARPFAPLSTYLFLGEAISRPERLSGKDWAEGGLSISRIAGTGLVMVDLLRTESLDSMQKILKTFAGQYLGGFTVPLRTIKDVTGETTVLNTSESPVLGPALSNIPVVGEKLLHPQSSITRGRAIKREETELRQATGLSIKTKTPLEQEIDRLNMQHLAPRTGDATLDRLLTEQAGPLVNMFGTSLIQKPAYRIADDETRKYMLRETLSKIKEGTRKSIIVPYYEGHLREHATPADKYKYLKDVVDRGRIGQVELFSIFQRQPWVFDKDKQQELLKKAYLR